MGLYRGWRALKAGSHATQTCEPRQVRKEATVSRTLRAPWGRLARASRRDTPICQRRPEVRGLFPMFKITLLPPAGNQPRAGMIR